jgi:hypothetical protein
MTISHIPLRKLDNIIIIIRDWSVAYRFINFEHYRIQGIPANKIGVNRRVPVE